MDLPSPLAKKVCLHDPQEYNAPAPATPIDDVDDDEDLYGDSPAISHSIGGSTSGPVTNDPSQLSLPSLQQETIFQLPGLGFSTGISGKQDQIVTDETEILDRVNGNIEHPDSKFPSTESEDGLPGSTKLGANGSNVAHDNSQGNQMEQHEQNGTSNVRRSPVFHGFDATNGHGAGQGPDNKETLTSETGEPDTAQSLIAGSSEGADTSTAASGTDYGSSATEFKDLQPDQPNGLGAVKPQTAPIMEQVAKAANNDREGSVLGPAQQPLTAQEDGTTELDHPNEAEEIGAAAPDAMVVESALKPDQRPSTLTKEVEQSARRMDSETVEPQQPGLFQTSTPEEPALHRAHQLPTLPESIEQQVDGTNTNSTQSQQFQQPQESSAPASKSIRTFKEIAEANKKDDAAEFELDSSPIESSSESDSESTSSSSEDSAGASDYEMLDPEEEARRLMDEGGGSDDEGKGGKAAPGPLRTLNEKPDEVVPNPEIEVTPTMAIAELGIVEHVVENSILIKAKTSGERQALESGSLLCLEDRSVIGVIAETLGQVQQPYYSVRFTNAAAIAEASITKGTLVFYVEQHSHYVFTQRLKTIKGSDASNINDEEVGDDELEFSDDEAEAEHKRRVKQERQARRGGRTDRGDGFARGPRGGRVRGGGRFNDVNERKAEPPPIKYDDQDDGDNLYTPLSRPSNLHEVMGYHEAPQEEIKTRLNVRSGSQDPRRGRPDRGRGRGDRGRGGRGSRGDARGGGGNNRVHGDRHYDNARPQHQNHVPPPMSTQSNHDSSFSSPYQPLPQHGWPTPYPSNQYNPSYHPYYPQPTSFHHLPQSTTLHSNSNQYPEMQSSPQYGHRNSNLTPQSPPPPPNHQYQPHSPTTPVPPSIPPGAHINPAFFSPTTQQSPQPWSEQQAYGNSALVGGGRSPQSEAAFTAAQDRLNLLRQLSQGGGPQG
ncbi:MAG: hypothetical protein L6R39_005170 [Caloplaca ligustica]|nr:MAG: hypothetical protein L6R39_005170 [Caloplaca ligustica]